MTGFGLAGHLLEICRGSRLSATVEFDRLPLLEDAVRHARDGISTGASTRNWAGYGHEVDLPAGFEEWKQKLATDPQTSGGLLVACAPEAADADLTWDAGLYRPASLGDFVWNDLDADGIQDGGAETGIDGVIVNLYDGNGTLIATTTTSGGGFYLFDNLVPGDYFVEFVPPAGYVISPQDQGGNNSLDSDANPVTGRTIPTTLTSGENDITWDGLSVAPTPGGLTKTITGTNLPTTTGTNTAIGEIVTYQVNVVVAPGTYDNATLVDTMERGLAFVACDTINAPGLTTDVAGSFASICSPPTTSDAGGGTTMDATS